MRKTQITTIGFAAMLVLQLLTRADEYRPRVGERHPEFTLPTISAGKPVSLSDYRGKKLLLIQFASW